MAVENKITSTSIVLRSALKPKRLKNRIAFIHVPKCGGSSLHRGVLASYGLWKNITCRGRENLEPPAATSVATLYEKNYTSCTKEILSYFLANQHLSYVYGHFYIDKRMIQHFSHDWNFITILRHPIDMWLSRFWFDMYKPNAHQREITALEDFVETQRARTLGRELIRRFTELPVDDDAHIDKAQQDAIDTLGHFRLIGTLDNIPGLIQRFKETFGVAPIVPHIKKSPAPQSAREQEIPEPLRKKIESLCEPSTQVYKTILRNT